MMKVCTKLVQWLTVAGLFFAVWTALLLEVLPIQLSHAMHKVVFIVSSPRYVSINQLSFILQLPLYLLVCFGVSIFYFVLDIIYFSLCSELQSGHHRISTDHFQ